jgi:6,7-dimethyl-8-ribityllumazine synthase
MDKTVNNVYEGSLVAGNLRFGIVCSRFNDLYVSKLLEGAVDGIVRHGGSTDNIAVAWVPGSFEIPIIAKKMADSGDYDAIIALGVVIQGATSHAHHINAEVAGALGGIGRDSGVPCVYGVVTVDTIEQAIERCGTKAGNRGGSAAVTAIEMANLITTMG